MTRFHAPSEFLADRLADSADEASNKKIGQFGRLPQATTQQATPPDRQARPQYRALQNY